MRSSQSDLLQRLAGTEANISALSKDVASVTQTVEQLANRIENRLSTIGKTDWSMLAGWAAVILSIVAMVGGAIGYGVSRDLSRIDQYIVDHEEWTKSKTADLDFERGKATQQREDLRASVAKLDIDLQREMRDVNATTEAKLNALDTRIQSEITNTISLLQGRLETLEEYQLRARETNAAQSERTRAIERAVFNETAVPLN